MAYVDKCPCLLQSLETQNGALFALGYLVGLLQQKKKSQESIQGSALWQKIEKRIEVAVKAIGKK